MKKDLSTIRLRVFRSKARGIDRFLSIPEKQREGRRYKERNAPRKRIPCDSDSSYGRQMVSAEWDRSGIEIIVGEGDFFLRFLQTTFSRFEIRKVFNAFQSCRREIIFFLITFFL